MTRESASPEQLERKIAKTRAEIDTTLDEIQERLSPGRILEQVMSYTKSNGGAFAGNLGRSLRDNPVPVMLMGVGLTWLMMADRKADGEYVEAHAGYRENSGSESISEQASDIEERGNAAATNTPEKVAHLAAEGREKGAQWRDDAQHMSAARDAAAAARVRAADAVGSAREGLSRTRDSAGRFVEENPLVVGALALAAGAVLGALVPTSRREEEIMGSESRRVRDAAKEQAEEMTAAAKTVADKARSTGADVYKSDGPSNREKKDTGGEKRRVATSSERDPDAPGTAH